MFCVADVWRLWPVVHLNAASAEKKKLRDLHVVRVLAGVLRKVVKGGSIYGNEAKPNKLKQNIWAVSEMPYYILLAY